ncbi:MAG: AmmeMemoRadiSam system radical SAM enzyme [Candidatus Omnitrophica bacterium]|nr:AmmeMemoRadiSam system radical SAM enzyme [Candidatus Omnitrophota bacterium]
MFIISTLAHHPAQFWHPLNGKLIQCDLCPRACVIDQNASGFCFVRKNLAGNLVTTAFNHTTGLAVDPIEKKPLYHFLPGSKILSFGTVGCNLGCSFCQNWAFAKTEQPMQPVTAALIIAAAQDHDCASVAFTYNEPVIFSEFAIHIAQACREHRLKTVAVTNGYIQAPARKEFFECMDATNVDLKGFSEAFYQKYCNAHLQPVLETLRYIHTSTKTWLEITNLLIPGANDNPDEIRSMCQWIAAELGRDVPIHFSAFHPDYRLLDNNVTPIETLKTARDIAQQSGLRFVYLGNVSQNDETPTVCQQCGQLIIRRTGYKITDYQLDETGHCSFCKTSCSGVFSYQS